jgi:hypothetical protein
MIGKREYIEGKEIVKRFESAVKIIFKGPATGKRVLESDEAMWAS